MSTFEALPAHIARHVTVDQSACWLWTGSRSPDGYGWASLANKTHQAHRLVYRLVKGDPPEGMHLDHLCRVRNCVNPDHLEPVSPRENLRRGDTPTGWQSCKKCGGDFGRVGAQRRCLRCLAEYETSRRESKRIAEAARRARLKAGVAL